MEHEEWPGARAVCCEVGGETLHALAKGNAHDPLSGSSTTRNVGTNVYCSLMLDSFLVSLNLPL